jgi:hypothetical protein
MPTSDYSNRDLDLIFDHSDNGRLEYACVRRWPTLSRSLTNATRLSRRALRCPGLILEDFTSIRHSIVPQ